MSASTIARYHPNARLTPDRPLQSKHSGNTSPPAVSIALEIQTVAALWFRCPPLPPRGETRLGSSGEDFLHECEIAPPNFLAKAVASLLFVLGRSGRGGRHYIGQYTEAVGKMCKASQTLTPTKQIGFANKLQGIFTVSLIE